MKQSLFSISYAGLWGQHRLEFLDFLSKARSLGYDGVMLAGKRPHLSMLDFTETHLHEIKEKLAAERLTCAVIGAYTDFSGLGPSEVPVLEMQIAYVHAMARLAKALGAGVVRVFSAYEHPGLSPAVVWNRAATALRECCDRAADCGVTIAVQNHHDVGVHTDALLELLTDIDRPNCKVGFDAWSPALRGEDLYESAKRIAPYTACTTNADYVRLLRFRYQPELVNYSVEGPPLVRAVPFGDGFIDYHAFFSGLRDGGFDGWATYEMCSPLRGGGSLENLDICAKRYLAWMNEMLQ